jgi:hypothetical protein
MSYPEPHTIEAEVDFKVEDAGKPCKTVKAHPVSYNCFPKFFSSIMQFRIPLYSPRIVLWISSDVLFAESVVLTLFEMAGTHFTSSNLQFKREIPALQTYVLLLLYSDLALF